MWIADQYGMSEQVKEIGAVASVGALQLGPIGNSAAASVATKTMTKSLPANALVSLHDAPVTTQMSRSVLSPVCTSLPESLMNTPSQQAVPFEYQGPSLSPLEC